MTVRVFRGYAVAVAQVDTLTVGGTVETGDLFVCTINGKDLSVAASSTSTSTTATDIETAWNASTIPEFAEITAAANGSTVVLTHDTEGVPFTCTVATTEAGGGAADDQTFGTASTTAATGPNHWDNAVNWSGNTLPINGDDVELRGDVYILYGLDQSAVLLDNLYRPASYTGEVGLPRLNPNDYVEYRGRYLQIGATNEYVGRGKGNHASRYMRDAGSVQTTLYVYGSGTSDVNDEQAIMWKGTHTDNAISVYRGEVGMATDNASEAADIATLTIGSITDVAGDATVIGGPGAEVITLKQHGGNVRVAKGANSVFTITAGTLVVAADCTGTILAMYIDGGTVYNMSTVTISMTYIGAHGALDFSRNNESRTVSACVLTAGGTIKDPRNTVTWTTGIDLYRCSLEDVTIVLGSHITITPSAI